VATRFIVGGSRSTRREPPTDFGKATGTLFHIIMLRVDCTLIFAIAQSQARACTTEVIGYNDLYR